MIVRSRTLLVTCVLLLPVVVLAFVWRYALNESQRFEDEYSLSKPTRVPIRKIEPKFAMHQHQPLWIGDPQDRIQLPNGDVLEVRFCPMSDSGVNLRRVRPADQAVIWEHDCAPLGAAHSVYMHKAQVHLLGTTAVINSIGSLGNFAEEIDLTTGNQIARSFEMQIK